MSISTQPSPAAPSVEGHHKIYAVSTEVPGSRINNEIAVMVYAYQIEDGETHWGIGAERNTQAMLAHGISRAANELFVDNECPSIHVISSDAGLMTYLRAHVPGWLRDGTREEKDASRAWVDLTCLSILSDFHVSKPINTDRVRFTNLQNVAKEKVRPFAEAIWRKEPARFHTQGVTLTDDTPGAPRLR